MLLRERRELKSESIVLAWCNEEAESTRFTRFKPLEKVKEKFGYLRVVLVDDSKEHFEMNEEGSVLLVKEFTGEYDEEFLRLRDLLVKMK
jgi:hypothetical protein